MPSSKNGKKRKKGIYSTNGINYKPVSHTKYKPGTKVINYKTGEKGIVLKKNNNKYSRSIIKVQFDNIKYISSKLLCFDDYNLNELNKNLSKCKINNRKNNKKKYIEKIHAGKNKLLKKAKRDLIEKLSNGIIIEVTNDNKTKYKCNFTGEEFIDNIIKINYNNLLKYYDNINYKNVSSNQIKLPKDIILKLFYYSDSKSSYNYISYINSKEEYYNFIHKYLSYKI